MKTLVVSFLVTFFHFTLFAQTLDFIGFDDLVLPPLEAPPTITIKDQLPSNWEKQQAAIDRWTNDLSTTIKSRNIEVTDSVYCYNVVEGERLLNNVIYYTYDEKGQLILQTSMFYDAETDTFSRGTQVGYTYDEEGRLTELVTNGYLDDQMEYQARNRVRHIYSTLSEPDTIYYESYQPNDTIWVTDYREVYFYENNLLSQVDIEIGSGDTWTVAQRGLFFYDENNQLVRIDVQEDMGDGLMTTIRQTLENYEDGVPTLIQLGLVGLTDEIVPFVRQRQEVENGLIIAVNMDQLDFSTSLWLCQSRTESSYSEMGNLSEQTSYLWQSTGEEFLPTFRSNTNYFDTSMVFNRETIREQNNPQFKSFLPNLLDLERYNEQDQLEYSEDFYWNGEEWILYQRRELEYDITGNLLSDAVDRSEPPSDVLRPVSLAELEYDSLNRLSVYQLSWDEINGQSFGTLVTTHRDSIFYDDDTDNILRVLGYRYIEDMLRPDFQLFYHYNSAGLRDTLWVEDYRDSLYVPSDRYIYEYENGLQARVLFQKYFGEMYFDFQRVTQTYDTTGNLLSSTQEMIDDNIWQTTSINTYTYDDNNLRTSLDRITFTDEGEEERRLTEYSYNADGELIQELVSTMLENYAFIELAYCETFLSDFVSNTNAQIIPLTACPLPNPYVQGTAINCEQLEMGVRYDLEVISVDGKLVQRQQLRGGDAVQISGLPTTGLYFLNWTNENGQRWVQRLFVR